MPDPHTPAARHNRDRVLESNARNLHPERIGALILATSSPDRLRPSQQAMLQYAGGIFVRGEFVTHRSRRGSLRPLPLPLSSAAVTNRLTSITQGISAVAQCPVYFRLGDYSGERGEFWETDVRNGLRGSGLLLRNPALLDYECSVARALQSNERRLRVVIPFVSSPEEQQQLTEIVKTELQPDQIGVMVESLSHARNIEKFPIENIQFIFPGPGDLGDELRATTDLNEAGIEAHLVDLGQELAYKIAVHGTDFLAFRCLAGHIEPTSSPVANQLIYNVYMPGQVPTM